MAEDAVSNQQEHNSNPETNTPILDEEQQQQSGGAPTTQPNPNPNPTRSHPEPLSLQLPASRWPSSAGRLVSDAAEVAHPPLQTAAPSQPPHPHPAVGDQGPVVLSTEEVPLTLPVPPAVPPPQSLLSADVGEPQGSQLLPAAAQLVVDMDEREDLGDLGQLGQMDGFDDDDNDIKIKQQQQQQQQQIRDDGANARSGGVGGGGNRAGGGASRLPGAPPGCNGGARSGGGAVPERAELLRRVFARYAVAPGQGRLVTDADFAEPRMSASTFQRAITELGLMAPTGPLTPESVGALFAKCKPPGNRKMNAAHFQQAMALLEKEAGGSVDVGAAAAAMAARLRQQKQQQGRPQQQQQGRGQGQQRSESEGAATRLPRLPPPPAPPPGRIRHSMNGSPPPKYAQERKQSDAVLAGRGGSGPVRNASYDPAGEAAGGGGVPRGALAPMVPPPRLAFVAAPGGGGGGPDAGAATDAAIALRNLNIQRSLTGIATLPQGYAILAAQSSAPQETPAPARLTALPSANSAAAAPLPHGAADPPGSLQSLSVRVSALEQQSQDLKSRLAAERLEILQRVADLASLTATAAKNAQQTPHSSTTTAATASGVSTNAVRSADDEVAAHAAANAVGVAHRAADGAAAARRAADEATAAATSAAEALEMLVARMEAVEATAAAEAGVRRRLEEEVAMLRARTGGMRTGSQMGFVGGEEDGEGQGGDDPARRRRQKFLEAEIATLRARVDEESAGRIRLREEVQLLRLKVEDEALQRSRLKEELNVQRARAEEVAQQQLQQLQIQLQQQQQLEVQQQHQLQQLQQQLQQVQQVQLMQQQRRTTGNEEDSSQQRQRLGDEVQMQKTRLEDEATQRVRLREEVSQLRIWLEEESRQRQLLATDVAQRLMAVDGCRNDVRRLEESVANIVAGALMAQLEPRVEQMVGRMMMMTQQGRAAGIPQVNVATPLDGKPTGADEATHGLVGTGWAQRVAALEMTMQAAETGLAAARAAAEAAQARVEVLAAEWAEVTSSATHSVMAKSVASASNAGLLALQTRVAQLVAAAEDQAARLQQLQEQIREGSPAAVAAATAAAVAASEARVVAATTAAATANDTARGAASEAATARLSAEVARAVAARAEAAVEALAARVEQRGVWQDNAGSKTSDPGPQTNPSDPAADADAWPEFEPASAEGSLASTAGGAAPATNVVLSTSAAMDAAETAGLLADVASISRDQAELLEALQARITALETAGAAYNSARQLQQAVLDEHTAEMQQLKAAVNLLQHQQAAAASASIAAGIGRLVSISGAGDEAPAGGGGGDVGYKLRKQLSEAQAEVQRFKEMLDKLGGRVEVLEAERRERRHSGTSGAEGAAAAAPSDGDGDGAGGSDAEGQKATTKESARALVEAAEQRLRNELEAAVQAVVNHEVSELRPLITRLDALEKQQQQRQGAEGAAGSAGDSPAGPQSDSSAAKPSTSPEASGTGEVTPSEFAAVRASVDELSQSVKRLDGVTTDLNEDMQFAARDVGRMLVQVRQLQQLYVALAESTGVKPPGPVVFPPVGAEGGPAGDPSGAAAAPESVAPAAAAGPGAPPPGAEKAGAGPEDAANGGVPSEGRQGPPPAKEA